MGGLHEDLEVAVVGIDLDPEVKLLDSYSDEVEDGLDTVVLERLDATSEGDDDLEEVDGDEDEAEEGDEKGNEEALRVEEAVSNVQPVR